MIDHPEGHSFVSCGAQAPTPKMWCMTLEKCCRSEIGATQRTIVVTISCWWRHFPIDSSLRNVVVAEHHLHIYMGLYVHYTVVWLCALMRQPIRVEHAGARKGKPRNGNLNDANLKLRYFIQRNLLSWDSKSQVKNKETVPSALWLIFVFELPREKSGLKN